jgi:moderate conductance mechanosensitive channel
MSPKFSRIGCLSPALAGLALATLAAGPAHAQAKPPTANVENVIGQILVLIRDGSKKLSERLGELFAATSEIGPQAERVLSLMTDLNGLPVLWQALPLMAAMWAIAGAVEWLLRRRIRPDRYWAAGAAQTDLWRQWLRRGAAFGLELLALGIFFFATMILSFVFFELGDPMRVLPVVLALIRVVAQAFWAAGRLLASKRPSLYALAGALGVGSVIASSMLMLYGLKAELAILLELACGTLAFAIVLAFTIRRALRRSGGGRVVIPLAVVLLWYNWASDLVLDRNAGAVAAAGALLCVLAIAYVADYIAALRAALPAAATEQQAAQRKAIDRLMAGIGACIRIALGFVAVLLAFESGPFGISAFLKTKSGGAVLAAAVNAAVAILIGYVLWALIKYWIDKRLAVKTTDVGASGAAREEGEGGTARVGTRAETLLPLFRALAFVLIAAIIALSVLSSFGVDIGPLLAGAGIVGIAVGFGAQSLVKDIFSGIFFLIDDAFRIGEYISFGSLRGEVEGISIRSLRLRHHRGPVHTVPYGEIRSITNYSRDWVIMKLRLGVKYGTDIDKVRKLIKKLGQEMQADPEYGALLLEPPKSQGILEFGDYAIIIRVKFKTKPREEFVIRRVLNERLKKLFEANGIEFAFPTVTVVSTPGGGDEGDLAAAAGTVIAKKPAEKLPAEPA